MIQTKKSLVIALFFPIIALAILTGYKKYILSFGETVVLPISGYDPRDILSGHYLIYRIEYGVSGECTDYGSRQAAYVCLEPKLFTYEEPEVCKKLIKGVCRHGRFEAGIEKFFIPENKAVELDTKIREKSASIVLSLTPAGTAQVKDLLIDGQPWDK